MGVCTVSSVMRCVKPARGRVRALRSPAAKTRFSLNGGGMGSAFDGRTSTVWRGRGLALGAAVAGVQLPASVYVSRYGIAVGAAEDESFDPAAWTFQGSSDEPAVDVEERGPALTATLNFVDLARLGRIPHRSRLLGRTPDRPCT